MEVFGIPDRLNEGTNKPVGEKRFGGREVIPGKEKLPSRHSKIVALIQ